MSSLLKELTEDIEIFKSDCRSEKYSCSFSLKNETLGFLVDSECSREHGEICALMDLLYVLGKFRFKNELGLFLNSVIKFEGQEALFLTEGLISLIESCIEKIYENDSPDSWDFCNTIYQLRLEWIITENKNYNGKHCYLFRKRMGMMEAGEELENIEQLEKK